MATIKGNSRSNRLHGTADGDVMFGLGGGDRLDGGEGSDVLYGDDDALSESFGSGDDRLSGGAGGDVLVSGAGADRLAGGEGDDLLIGGFATGVTNDGLNFGYGYSTGGDDSYDGGAGFDSAILSFVRAEAITLDISSIFARAITADGVRVGTIRGVEAVQVFLGWGGDTVTGGANGDELHGRDGDDVLAGGGGADRLDGGLGDDRLSGGEGFDTLSYGHAAVGVTVNLGLAGQAQDTVGAGIDTFDGFEQVDGSNYSDRLIGGAADDFITAGNGGSDRLFGGVGADHLAIARLAGGTAAVSTLNGGEGDDVLSVSAAAGAPDVINVIGGNGADTAILQVAARQAASLGAGEDRVVLSLAAGDVAITLGKGVDTVAFDGIAGVPEGQTAAHVLDFAAGNNGDRVDLRDLLAQAAAGYQPGSNPFAGGFVRLITGSDGTELQFDVDAGGSSHDFVTVLAMDGVQPQDFTAFNFGGADPLVSAPILFTDHHWPTLVALA